jgi:integrase
MENGAPGALELCSNTQPRALRNVPRTSPNRLDDVKTDESRKKLVIDRELLSALQAWKRITQFGKSSDWVFASPVQLGRLPWSYHYVRRVYRQAAKDAGIGEIGTHSMRHTYRSWLDSQGTPLGVQQNLMRHVNIATTIELWRCVLRRYGGGAQQNRGTRP